MSTQLTNKRRRQALRKQRRIEKRQKRLQAAEAKATPTMQLEAMADVQESASEDDAPTFTLDAYSGGIMFPHLNGVPFEGPAVIDISGLEANATIPSHRDHDRTRPVGHATASFGDRVRCEGVFSIDNDDSREIRSGAKKGFPWRASVGLSHMRYEIIEAGQSVNVNGRSFDGPILHVTSARLDEVSFVTIAGDNATEPAIAANKPSGAGSMNFSQWLQQQGWEEASLSESQLATLKLAFEAQQAGDNDNAGESASNEGEQTPASEPADEGGATQQTAVPATAAASASGATLQAGSNPTNNSTNTLQAQREQAAAETERIAVIQALASRYGSTLVAEAQNANLIAHAIREGWTPDQTELYAMRQNRPAPAGHSTSSSQRGSLEALQAGIMLRAGRSIDQQVPAHPLTPGWMSRPVNDSSRQQIMDSAQEFRDLSMIDYTARGLQAMGRGQSFGAGRAGQLATLQAGFSTGATAAIFTQAIGAMALTAYRESGDFTNGWTSEADVPNLLDADRVRLQAAPDLTHHATGDEAEHAHREAKSESVRADRFSRTAEIDENDFINDRFQLLREIPRDFGRAAARLRPNMVAAVLLANSALKDGVALFNGSHNNVLTGSALSQANLQKARALISKQKDGDASLNHQPSHLIVPTDLGDLAIQLTMSAIITNDSGAGGMNPTRTRNITPVEESRLSNGVVDPLTGSSLAGSLTTYYLVANDAHTIEVQFLDGTGRVPMVVVEQLSHGKFGLSITVKHFIGAKALDFRGMARMQA